MQLARAYSDHLTVIAACRLAFEDDFGGANHDVTEQQDAPDTADHSPQRRDGKNTAFPPSYSKRGVLQISVEARADPYSSPAPPSASGAKPGNASNAHAFFTTGSSLEVCHGKPDEVQRCAQNERRVCMHF
jgi:hypothetical protein